MEYAPTNTQPFTLQEAIQFDLSVILEEIARLEISVNKLGETQAFLRSYLEETPDVEIASVLEENKVVIKSQEERIDILKKALTEKGIGNAALHYEINQPSESTTYQEPPRQTQNDNVEGNDGSLFL